MCMMDEWSLVFFLTAGSGSPPHIVEDGVVVGVSVVPVHSVEPLGELHKGHAAALEGVHQEAHGLGGGEGGRGEEQNVEEGGEKRGEALFRWSCFQPHYKQPHH